ncbi:hypothetical protein Celly_3048 [Cellulophaga lytica DSM 7489]|uniref:Uncharacterized protein n=1 Tax=Cellulophaga lytica (strain ATCC 23178 / DSM 7489 / JCM 8516 / NBRC 14961 / NCIMB 1423 / VKM B-1433 / Cy l20) TaxID=867900 RepID=F0RDC3_CELLC|nr:hypothetical protein Celly_3048 [Cellulophaga lytica DSM 7489]
MLFSVIFIAVLDNSLFLKKLDAKKNYKLTSWFAKLPII